MIILIAQVIFHKPSMDENEMYQFLGAKKLTEYASVEDLGETMVFHYRKLNTNTTELILQGDVIKVVFTIEPGRTNYSDSDDEYEDLDIDGSVINKEV